METFSPSLMKLLFFLVGLVAIAYLSICLVLLARQNRLIFFPTSKLEVTPALYHLPYAEIWLPVRTAAGSTEKVHGWWLPQPEPQPSVLLYLHGNGVNMGANVELAARFHSLGLPILMVDYRGYGRSEGSFPTEATVYQDAEAAWNYLIQQGYTPKQIILFGHSLGGAIAIELATAHPQVAGLIVQSSFTSIKEMTQLIEWTRLFPVELLLTQRFDSITKVQALRSPVLYLHGLADKMVPAQMSQTLFELTPGTKELVLFPDAGHNNLAEVGGSRYLKVIRTFVHQVEAKRQVSVVEPSN